MTAVVDPELSRVVDREARSLYTVEAMRALTDVRGWLVRVRRTKLNARGTSFSTTWKDVRYLGSWPNAKLTGLPSRWKCDPDTLGATLDDLADDHPAGFDTKLGINALFIAAHDAEVLKHFLRGEAGDDAF